MKCPTCADQVLVMTERSGVEIDYCPACRGVWLDRGELDKILERAATSVPAPLQAAPMPVAPVPAAAPSHAPLPQPRPRWDDDDRRSYDRDDAKPYKKKKRSSIFEEIFDF